MNIDAVKPVETRCIFFAPDLWKDFVWTSLLPSSKRLISDNYLRHNYLIYPPCIATLSKPSLAVSSIWLAVAQMLWHPAASRRNFQLAAGLLHLYNSIRDQVARLPSVRSATRQELYRRLLIGREYFHSQASGPLSLASVSRAAGLSLFHFHRGFTQAFRQTPHSYLTQLRLTRSRQLIEAGSPVLDACLEVGFQPLGLQPTLQCALRTAAFID